MTLVSYLNAFDYLVIFAFVAATFIILGISRLKHSQDSFIDYMLMGRTLTFPVFTATLVATWYGGIVGVTEIAYQHGVYNFVTQGVFWYVTYVIFAFFLVDRVRQFEAVTLPELVGKMYGPRSAKIAAVFNFFNVVPIAYTLSLGILLQVVFGIPLIWGMVLGTSFVCAYSMVGGFRSVVATDILQFVCMCLAVSLLLGFAFATFGGWDYLTSALPSEHFSITGGHQVSTLFVWGFIALATLVDPSFYQRCFAAQSNRTAKQGILAATFIWLLFDLCTTFGAMYAAAAMPQLTPAHAYLMFGFEILPHGLKGFFLVGIVATIISTMDSFIFIASNTLTYDFLPQRWRRRLDLSRASIWLVGLISVGIASMFDGSIKETWKTLGSFSAGCLLLPMLIGYRWPRRFRDQDFAVASITGAVAILFWRFTPHAGFWAQVDDLYAGLLATGVAFLFMIALKRINLFDRLGKISSIEKL